MVKLRRVSLDLTKESESTNNFSVDSHEETLIQGYRVSILPKVRDQIKRSFSPILEHLEKEYEIDLEPLVIDNQEEADSYLLFASMHDVDSKDTNIPTFLSISKKILYSGSYVDIDLKSYLLSVQIDINPNNSFSIWIRPELKGNSYTKAENQKDFSFLEKWCETNVLDRVKNK